MSTGYMAAFATLFSWTVAIFILARLSRLEASYILNKAVLFFSIFSLGILVCVLDGLTPWQLFSLPGSSNWLWLGISGILGKSVGDYCGFSALRTLGARRRTMLTTLTPAFTWLFGLVVLHEGMNWVGVFGMFITTASVMLLLNDAAEQKEVNRENFGSPLAGYMFGIAGAALTGLAFILAKMALIDNAKNLSAFHGTWVRVITAFTALMALDLVRKKNLGFIKPFLSDRKRATLLFLAILFNVVLGLSFSLMAITAMNAAEAYTIFSLVPVTVIIVSVVVYKKPIGILSVLYSMLAVAGVILLVWRDLLARYFGSL